MCGGEGTRLLMFITFVLTILCMACIITSRGQSGSSSCMNMVDEPAHNYEYVHWL